MTAQDISDAIERVARGTEAIGAYRFCHRDGFCFDDAHAALAGLAGSPSFRREALVAFAFAVGVDLGVSR